MVRFLKTMRSALSAAALIILAGTGPVFAQAAAGPTLTGVRERGQLTCSTSGTSPGFGLFDSRGEAQGIDTDICRAVAAAIFGEARVRFLLSSTPQRVINLQSGTIDMAVQSLTWTQTREANNGLMFAGIHYYDGQAFLVRRSLNITSARGLAGATVCMPAGGRAELNAVEWGRAHGVQFTSLIFDRTDQVMGAYEAGRCDAVSNDGSLLSGLALRLNRPADHMLLPERISKEPLGAYVRKGDDQWFDIVRWTIQALINAEELGVTQANLDQMLQSTDPLVQRLLGSVGDHGRFMGLDNRWAYQAIRAVGNYGEIFNRHFGPNSAMPTERGLNGLWTNGGLMYGAPIQ